MMNSKALSLLSKIEIEINETQLQQTIDEPVIKAVRMYQAPNNITNHSEALQFIGNITRHIFFVGFSPPRILTNEQARMKGIDIIGKANDFESVCVNLLNDPGHGMEKIIQDLVGQIIKDMRNKYVSGILSYHIDPWDYDLNMECTRILHAGLRQYFSIHLEKPHISMFVPYLPKLILGRLKETTQIIKLMSR